MYVSIEIQPFNRTDDYDAIQMYKKSGLREDARVIQEGKLVGSLKKPSEAPRASARDILAKASDNSLLMQKRDEGTPGDTWFVLFFTLENRWLVTISTKGFKDRNSDPSEEWILHLGRRIANRMTGR